MLGLIDILVQEENGRFEVFDLVREVLNDCLVTSGLTENVDDL